MSAVAVTIEYQVGSATGELVLERMAVAFERAGAELADFSEHVFPRLQTVLEDAVREQFDAEGKGPQAGDWKPLTPAYEAWKEERFPGQPILVATGALRDALTVSGSAHALRDNSASQFNFGTQGLEYASFHQVGTTRMVARPPFDFVPAFEREMLQAAAEGVREGIKAATLDEYTTLRGGP